MGGLAHAAGPNHRVSVGHGPIRYGATGVARPLTSSGASRSAPLGGADNPAHVASLITVWPG